MVKTIRNLKCLSLPEENQNTSFFFSKNTRSENLNTLISAYLNINTIGSKFDFPAEQVQ